MPKLKYIPIIDIVKDNKKVQCFGTRLVENIVTAFILTTDGVYHHLSMTKEEVIEKRDKNSSKINAEDEGLFNEIAKIYVLKMLYKTPVVKSYFQDEFTDVN